MPALLGVDAMAPSQPVLVEHLEAATARAGLTVRAATSCSCARARPAAGAPCAAATPAPSSPASTRRACRGCTSHEIAALGSDVAQDVHPTGVPGFSMPIHTVGLVAMGLWLIDNCDLDELAAALRRAARWAFQFVLAPLRFRGATGSPANPLAIF